jgi:hypothetical protein
MNIVPGLQRSAWPGCNPLYRQAAACHPQIGWLYSAFPGAANGQIGTNIDTSQMSPRLEP